MSAVRTRHRPPEPIPDQALGASSWIVSGVGSPKATGGPPRDERTPKAVPEEYNTFFGSHPGEMCLGNETSPFAASAEPDSAFDPSEA